MTGSRRVHARRSGSRRTLLGAVVGGATGLVLFVTVPGIQPGAGAAADPVVGSQGVVTSLPATASAVTVSGSGAYAGLKVTVNQTANLVDQAVSVSWTGGTQTTSTSQFQANYLQIFECWGDPQSTDPATTTDPGPLPSQCQFGGEATSSSAYPVSGAGSEYSRIISQHGWSTFPPDCDFPTGQPTPAACSALGYFDPTQNYLVEPFDAVDGTVIGQQADYNYNLDPYAPKPFWLNPYFRYGTSNEVDFARTYADGTGTQLFQVQTGLQAPGLGCGQQLQKVAGGTKVPQCWLVVVPRGTPAEENPANVVSDSVTTSPLSPAAWANRIAVPLSFNPVGSSCAINATASQILGNEAASSAVDSWQPALCDQAGSPSYSYIESTDDQARQNIVSPTYGSAGMSVATYPADPSETTPTNPIVYAPVTLSGVAVAFNIQRVPAQSGGTGEQALSGTQVQNLYLTPRLMAKLLTQSYQAQFQDITAKKPAGYGWALHNPIDLFTDPDFLQWNPEFKDLSTTQAIDAGTALVEEPTSDAATEVWKWILADPEARAWLDGTPDDGMVVNPLYSINPKLNPSGVAFDSSTLNEYPKSDPYCYSTGQTVVGPPSAPARKLCILDWSPYSLTLQAAAQATGAANDGAKTTFNLAGTADTAWSANGPQVPGTHFVISITDTPSAARYGLQTASLSRSGDDGATRSFVAPDAAGLIAGEQSDVPSAVSGVLVPDPSTTATGAYPLTLLSYASTAPETLTTAERTLYTNFILFAIGNGQTSGVEPGQLPPGYVPLPGALRLEALNATNSILHPPAEPTDATTTGDTGGGSNASSTGSPATTAFNGDTSAAAGDQTSSEASGTGSSSPAKGSGSAALGLIRTSSLSVGRIRYLLPLLLLIGVGAGLGSLALARSNRLATSAPPGADTTATEDIP
jgi:hypothetical protein